MTNRIINDKNKIKLISAVIITFILWYIFNLPMPELGKNKQWIAYMYPYTQVIIPTIYFFIIIFNDKLHMIYNKRNEFWYIPGLIIGIIPASILNNIDKSFFSFIFGYIIGFIIGVIIEYFFIITYDKYKLLRTI